MYNNFTCSYLKSCLEPCELSWRMPISEEFGPFLSHFSSNLDCKLQNCSLRINKKKYMCITLKNKAHGKDFEISSIKLKKI